MQIRGRYFNEYRRLSSESISRPTPASPIESKHEDILHECIIGTLGQIDRLLSRIGRLQANLMTISRCIAQYLPTKAPLYGTDEYERWESIGAFIKQYVPKSTPPEEIEKANKAALKRFYSLGSLSESPRPTTKQVPLPKTIDLAGYRDNRDTLEIKLQLLVLKQAELAIDEDQLIGELVFWAEIHEGMRTAVNSGRNPCLSPEAQSQEVSEWLGRAIMSSEHTTIVGRKAVPVMGMLERDRIRAIEEERMKEESILGDVNEEEVMGRKPRNDSVVDFVDEDDEA